MKLLYALVAGAFVLSACGPPKVTESKKKVVVDGVEYRTGTDDEEGWQMVFVDGEWEQCPSDDCVRGVLVYTGRLNPWDTPGASEGGGGGDSH